MENSNYFYFKIKLQPRMEAARTEKQRSTAYFTAETHFCIGKKYEYCNLSYAKTAKADKHQMKSWRFKISQTKSLWTNQGHKANLILANLCDEISSASKSIAGGFKKMEGKYKNSDWALINAACWKFFDADATLALMTSIIS